MPSFRIVPATVSQAAAFVQHLHRHFAESGQDGDLIFHPVDSVSNREFVDDLNKTLDTWKRYPPTPGWVRAWLVLDDADVVRGHLDLRGGQMPASIHRCTLGMGLERVARSQGFGARLIATATEWAEEDPYLEWIDLYVFAHNAHARHLYDSMGFEELAEVRDLFRVGGQSINDVHMVLRLKA